MANVTIPDLTNTTSVGENDVYEVAIDLGGGTMASRKIADKLVGGLKKVGTAWIGGDQTGNPRGNAALDVQSNRVFVTDVAAGNQSSVFGYANKVNSSNSVAIGYRNAVIGAGAGQSAFGGYNTTNGNGAASAFGYFNLASGLKTSAFGYYNSASAELASAFGTYNTASAAKSSAFGYENIAGGVKSSAFGYANWAEGLNSSSFGCSTAAFGEYSSAAGYGSSARSHKCSAFGYSNSAGDVGDVTLAQKASAFGYKNTASGTGSSAFGYSNTASGNYSKAFGYSCTASAAYATAFGHDCGALSSGSSAFGYNAVSSVSNTTVINGPQIIPKSQSSDVAVWVHRYVGVETIFTTGEVDLKSTATFTLTLPAGCKFWLDEAFIIVTSLTALSAQPSISFGITGNTTKYQAAVQTTALTANGKRQRYAVTGTDGEVTLTASVTTGATATTMTGRFGFRGLLVEDQTV